MYQLLNQNVELLISEGIHFEHDVKPYSWLMKRMKDGTIAADAEFQRRYRTYWATTGARLSPAFCKGYFRLMDRLRSVRPVDIAEVLRALHKIPSQKNDRHSLQLSFASKLVHTLDPHRPMYDSFVSSFFFLPDAPPGKAVEVRLNHLVRSYTFLESEYRRVLAEGLLHTAITRFRDAFDGTDRWTDQRVVDMLIWSFSKFLSLGALRDGKVRYR